MLFIWVVAEHGGGVGGHVAHPVVVVVGSCSLSCGGGVTQPVLWLGGGGGGGHTAYPVLVVVGVMQPILLGVGGEGGGKPILAVGAVNTKSGVCKHSGMWWGEGPRSLSCGGGVTHWICMVHNELSACCDHRGGEGSNRSALEVTCLRKKWK